MKKRIIILSAFASPLRSGAEACAEEVPAALQNQYDFTIVTARMRRHLPKTDTLQGVPVIRIGLGCSCDKWLFPFLAPFTVRALQPDVIHAVLETFAGLALHFCKFVLPKAKRMLTLQTTNTSFLKGIIIKSPNKVTAISSALVDIAKSFGRNDVIQISNGLHLHHIPAMASEPGRVVFVGRLEKMKGVDVLLTAFARLSETGNRLPAGQAGKPELRIVGEGSERTNLESIAQSLGIADRVSFAGFIPVPDVYKEFAQAEIFCGLSRSEALGNVFLEAQAAECAVIGTNIGGIPDIVSDGETGLLIPPDSVVAATEALEKLLNDAALRKKLASNGMQNAKQYDWSNIAERYREVYESLLGNG